VFTFNVNITGSRTVDCKEFTNGHFKTLLKLNENNDDVALSKHFEKIVNDLVITKTKLNYVDKLIILLKLREVCIKKTLEIVSEGTNSTVSMKFLIDKILENYNDKTEKIYFEDNDIEIEIGFPLTIRNIDNVYDKIHSIKIGDYKTDLHSLSEEEKDKILEQIPSSYAKVLVKKFKNIQQKPSLLFKYQSGKEQRDYYCTFEQEQNFSMLKLCYGDSLKNFYYMEYICCSKLHIGLSDFLDRMTPVESKMHFDELIKEHNSKNQPKNQNQMPSAGLGVGR
jgi:hypothetical protein|tara:strand:- start:2148 stop:2990 length:843 start_codon:yes stop_codon:yes gene_type:complete